MSRFLYLCAVIVVLFSLAVAFAEAQEPKSDDGLSKIDLSAKNKDKEELAKKILKDGKKGKGKKEKSDRIEAPSGMKVYHHVHHSVASKDVKPRMKTPKMVSANVFGADDIEAEKLDQLRKKDNASPNALVAEYEMKYQKVLAEVINDLKVTMQTPTYVVLKEVEKRMEEKEQKSHIKTSARMMEYLRRMIAKLYESYEDTDNGGKKYGIKEFVSSVFGKYRLRHEEEQERKRRIEALTDHINKKHNKKEHRMDFHDTFYKPKFAGFDEETGAALHVYAPMEKPKKYGDHQYSDTYNGEVLYDSPVTLKAADKEKRKPGLIPRGWNKLKGLFA